ncbi:MAG TPA: acetate/propionate family kinase [Ktedonobacterales bacterium]
MPILTLNTGSSSIKFALYEIPHVVADERLVLAGSLERIGLPNSRFHVADASRATLVDEACELPESAAAIDVLLRWLASDRSLPPVEAVGHRIVHGGPRHMRPERITPALLAALRALTPLAPAHLPGELAAIAAVSAAYPQVPQVACFDTAFHRSRPRVAQVYGLPWRFTEQGVLRYGFHGLSYEYILQELARETGTEVAHGRLVVAHLGNGSSMAAILRGKSMDATMGFTPLGGMVMSTRTGDLDPGVLLYLLEERRLTPAELRTLVGDQSGLLGISGISSDMRDLLARQSDDPRAALAVELYCYTARKYLGALAAVLGGLDTLIFTAGIGEHAAPIRTRICSELGFLGIQLDAERNAADAAIISATGAAVTVRVLPTNEELMIARHTAAVLRDAQGAPPPTNPDECIGGAELPPR